MHRLGIAGIVTTALIAASAPAALAADGDLDPSFASGAGFRIDHLEAGGTIGSVADGLTLGADGSPFVTAFAGDAGGTESQFTVAKFLPDGSALDPTFATAGVRRDQRGFGANPYSDGGNHLTLAPDGTLVVPGVAGDDSAPILSEADIQRYTATGGLDTAFAGGAVRSNLSLSPSGHTSSFSDAVVNPDESVVAVGSDRQTGFKLETLIAKYTPAGTLDTSFGAPNGFVHLQLGTGADSSNWSRVVRQPDGKLVALGESQGTTNGIITLVERFNPDGTPDTGFGTGGLVKLQLSTLSPLTEHKTADGGLALAPDGSIIVGADVSYITVGPDDDRFQQAIVKLTPAGAMDATFGTGGVVLAQFGHDGPGTHADTSLSDLALAPDGRIVTAGAANDAADRHGVLVTRYLPNGTLDPAFGSGGVFTHQFADGAATTAQSQAQAVAVTPSGAIVLAGLADDASAHLRSLLARLVGNSAPVAAIAPVTGAKEEVPIGLDASGSTDDGDIASYSWDLNGDGTFGDATGAKVTQAFGPGPHTVMVKVTDSYGLSTTAKQTFTVLAEPGVVKLPTVATVKGKTASLTISCKAGPACNGIVALSSVTGTHAKTAKAKAKTKHRATNYGKSPFKVAAGKHKVIRIRLTLAARAALRYHHSLHAWLTVTTKAAGRVLNTHRVITLHNHNPVKKHRVTKKH